MFLARCVTGQRSSSRYAAEPLLNQEDPRNDILRHCPTLLSRWRGGRARMHELTASIKTLTIRVERSGVYGNLHIACIAPTHICGPVDWDDCDIQVSIGTDDTFVVRDIRAGLEIHAGRVEVKENCKPLYTPA
jgi:hypothetical protein